MIFLMKRSAVTPFVDGAYTLHSLHFAGVIQTGSRSLISSGQFEAPNSQRKHKCQGVRCYPRVALSKETK